MSSRPSNPALPPPMPFPLHSYMKKLILSLSLIASTLPAATFTGADGATVEVDQPRRIVALNRSTAEILRDLGADGLVIGADSSAAEFLGGETIAKLGHPYRPDVEAITKLKPDLVLATADAMPAEPAAQLRAAGLAVLVLENSSKDGIDGLKRRLAVVGSLLGKETSAEELARELDARLARLQAANASIAEKRRVLFIYRRGASNSIFYGAGSGPAWLVELAGARYATTATENTPLSTETLKPLAPDAIIILQRAFDSAGGADGIVTLPGVADTPAGQAKAVYPVDSSIRWIGTRYLDHVEALHRQLYAQP